MQGGGISRSAVESKIVSWQSDLLGGHVKGLIGWRDDKQESFEQAQAESFRFADNEYNPATLVLAGQPSDVQAGSTRTWSVVGVYPERWLGSLPFGADLRVFMNESENFNPVGARRNIRNELLAAPTGKTKEYGVMLDLYEGKISTRLSIYDTSVRGQTLGSLGGTANAAMRWPVDWVQRARSGEQAEMSLQEHAPDLFARGVTSYQQLYQEILKLITPEMQAIGNYRLVHDDGGGTFMHYEPIQNLTVTRDSVSKGWELEVTAKPTRNIQIMFNLAKQEAVQSNVAPALNAYATDFLARIQASPLNGIQDTLTEPSLSTYTSRFTTAVNVPLAAEKAKEGTASQELREWRANLVASYRFREGWLKGTTAGTAVRWQSEVATGYRTAPNEHGLPIPILANAYYDDPDLRGDFFLRFERRFGRVDWKLQLNVRNAIGSSNPITVFTNPDGQVAVVRAPPPTEWFLTNTFRF
jgi:hypothetical protein